VVGEIGRIRSPGRDAFRRAARRRGARELYDVRALRPTVGWPRSSSSTSSRAISIAIVPRLLPPTAWRWCSLRKPSPPGWTARSIRGRRAFLYLPYMHSESALIHALAVRCSLCRGMERQPRLRTCDTRRSSSASGVIRTAMPSSVASRRPPNSNSSRRQGRPSRTGKERSRWLTSKRFDVHSRGRGTHRDHRRGGARSCAPQGWRSVWSMSLSSIPVARWC
jgi:hypothetical protein